MLVILDSIRSAHNVGSIFRTADAVGIDKLYLCGVTPAPLDRFGRVNQRLAKVSLGAEKSMPWESHPDTLVLLKELKKSGVMLLALEQHKKAESVFKFRLKSGLNKTQSKKTALILGPEVEGLSAAVLKLTDHILEIPMRGTKESLNVSVAFGIAAYQLLKTQLSSGSGRSPSAKIFKAR